MVNQIILRTCPFCGSPAKVTVDAKLIGKSKHRIYVACSNRFCIMTSDVGGWTPEQWNSRHAETKEALLSERDDALREVQACHDIMHIVIDARNRMLPDLAQANDSPPVFQAVEEIEGELAKTRKQVEYWQTGYIDAVNFNAKREEMFLSKISRLDMMLNLQQKHLDNKIEECKKSNRIIGELFGVITTVRALSLAAPSLDHLRKMIDEVTKRVFGGEPEDA